MSKINHLEDAHANVWSWFSEGVTLLRRGSVELVNEVVAHGSGAGSGGHPVLEDSGHDKWVECDPDAADSETIDVEEPSEDPCAWEETFNLL